mmetsp:Transcript_3967/g.8940  ORF Transcript_3967/g.8940 Transcript_3967/m.8940 type:complete len:279 (-) Transcript_3967:387-1223(-)
MYDGPAVHIYAPYLHLYLSNVHSIRNVQVLIVLLVEQYEGAPVHGVVMEYLYVLLKADAAQEQGHPFQVPVVYAVGVPFFLAQKEGFFLKQHLAVAVVIVVPTLHWVPYLVVCGAHQRPQELPNQYGPPLALYHDGCHVDGEDGQDVFGERALAQESGFYPALPGLQLGFPVIRVVEVPALPVKDLLKLGLDRLSGLLPGAPQVVEVLALGGGVGGRHVGGELELSQAVGLAPGGGVVDGVVVVVVQSGAVEEAAEDGAAFGLDHADMSVSSHCACDD